MCLIKHHILRIYGEEDVQLHPFQTSALNGTQWSTPHSGRYIPTGRITAKLDGATPNLNKMTVKVYCLCLTKHHEDMKKYTVLN
jgi:hypothetical protein